MPTKTSGVARVNGIELGYQVVGEGESLILLHGGLGVTHYDINVVPALSTAVIPFLDGA
jgi:hypothetical protein